MPASPRNKLPIDISQIGVNMIEEQAKKAAVLRPGNLVSHDRGGGARTTPLVTPSVGASSFINGITSFEAGVAIPFHSHNCEESVMLLEGEAILDIDGQELHLQPQDTTFIPANVPHRFRNTSPTAAMKIFWTYGRIDATRTVIATGVTNPVSAEHSKK
jgi:quercetin dioxygenase-like cupin family protein